MRFDALPLHDAVLSSIHLRWDDGQCTLRLRPVGQPQHLLVFDGCSHIALPRRANWGPSPAVLAQGQPGEGRFEIAMQSGDTLEIEARGWAWRPDDA